MTKQEEIREGIARKLFHTLFNQSNDLTWLTHRHTWLPVADGFLQYLHSKGVVIKRERDCDHLWEDNDAILDCMPPISVRICRRCGERQMQRGNEGWRVVSVAIESLIEGGE